MLNKKKNDKKKRRPGWEKKFNDSYYVRAFQLSSSGLTNRAIAQALGISEKTLKTWMAANSHFKEAIISARGTSTTKTGKKTGETFMDYAYARLPHNLKEIWDQLEMLSPDDPIEACEAILGGQPTRVRQWLFFHALITSNFSKAEACRKVGISYETVKGWSTKDKEFQLMMTHLFEMKQDYFEGALLNLVAGGCPAATIFANKTINANRGYNPKVTVVHEGQIDHAHVDVNHLITSMSPEAQKQLLDAVRSSKALKNPIKTNQALPEHVPDAEIVKTKKGSKS